jgi:sigma-E factor negative regulatory protein RseA
MKYMIDKQSRTEQLSCFMDGEVDRNLKQAVAQHDEETRGCWRRYHLIRDVLRDAQPLKLSSGFCDRVMHALENEPVIFCPNRIARSRLSAKYLKPVAGLAIAASVAAVTVFSLQTLYLSPSDAPLAVAATVQQPAVPASGNLTVVSGRADTGASEDDNLDAYLIGHMEHASAAGAQGIMPFVRLAGYERSQ